MGFQDFFNSSAEAAEFEALCLADPWGLPPVAEKVIALGRQALSHGEVRAYCRWLGQLAKISPLDCFREVNENLSVRWKVGRWGFTVPVCVKSLVSAKAGSLPQMRVIRDCLARAESDCSQISLPGEKISGTKIFWGINLSGGQIEFLDRLAAQKGLSRSAVLSQILWQLMS